MSMKVKVGLFGIGLDTYWPQFDGLLDKLMGYQEQIKRKIAEFDVEVADAGMVDNPVKAREAAIRELAARLAEGGPRSEVRAPNAKPTGF